MAAHEGGAGARGCIVVEKRFLWFEPRVPMLLHASVWAVRRAGNNRRLYHLCNTVCNLLFYIFCEQHCSTKLQAQGGKKRKKSPTLKTNKMDEMAR